MGVFGKIADGIKSFLFKVSRFFRKAEAIEMRGGYDRHSHQRPRNNATTTNVNGTKYNGECKLGRRHFTYLGIDGVVHVGRKGKPYRVAPGHKLYLGGVA